MFAHAGAAPDPVCVLQGLKRDHRIARRALAVGHRPVPARESADTHSSDRHDHLAIRHAEDDAQPDSRSGAGQDDDVHAVNVWYLLL